MGRGGLLPLVLVATTGSSMQEVFVTDTCSTYPSDVQPHSPLFHDCPAVPVLEAMLGFTRSR